MSGAGKNRRLEGEVGMDQHQCEDMIYSLSEYVDNALSEEICAEIERHLEECDNCRIVVDSLRKTIYLYRVTTEPPNVPDDVRQRLMHRLNLDEFLHKQNKM